MEDLLSRRVAANSVKIFKYPLNDQNDYKGKIVFQVVEEGPLKLDFAANYLNVFKDVFNFKDGTIRGTENINIDQFLKNVDKTGNSNLGKTPTKFKDKVELYLPQQLQFATGVNIDNFDLGLIGGITESALNGGSSIAGAAFSGLTNLSGKSISDSIKQGLKEDAASLAAVRLSAIGGEQVQGAVRSATRTTFNPNTRAMFKGVPLREFSFSFKMIAQSKDEAEEIKNIIKLFRKEMLPTKITPAGEFADVAIGYKFPSKFTISLKYRDTDVATKIKRCYLRNVNVTYNSSSMGMHSDGNFTEVDMTLSFVEDRALTREDVEAGY